MSAIIIDLKDFDVRTPEQVVRIFYSLYTPESVREHLWGVFRLCAVNDSGESSKLNLDTSGIAMLFDHLIALSNAVHQLRLHTEGKCVVCGRDAEDTSE
jgi:hypothetical protein